MRKRTRFNRELTAVAGIPVLVWLIGWASEIGYIALIVAVCVFALDEFLSFGKKKGYPVHSGLSLILMLVLLSGFIFPDVSVEMGVFAVLLIIPARYVFSKSDINESLPASAVCVLGTLYIGMLGGALLRLRLDYPEVGSRLVFFLLIVVWMGDAGAYYVGKRFGKTRLSPRVSPKKTVEGLLGGILFSILGAAIIHFTFFPQFPLVHALIAAALLSITGVIGDLAESLWKRSAAVKDSGTRLPGHGGFLDRCDSILFTAPILYSYWYLLSHPFQFR
ncbi:MAG TPA: phosphatidate cytidylyltransferase [Thermoanaerobaculia bacterium]|nr:phosphatidate cytidylyltransferase [Thermoanaerobaculia bacterium]